MLQKIDYFLDRITMYRLVFYILICLLTIASILGFFSLVPFSPTAIIVSALFLVGSGWIANTIFAWAFDAPTNSESIYITAMILALIITPANSLADLPFLAWATILAMLSKFVLAINKKHIFNPAAIAVVITGLFLGKSASWWVGTAWMAPFVGLAGFFIIRKLRFSYLAWGFFTTMLVVSSVIGMMKGDNLLGAFSKVIFDSSFLFLGSIMVTEPLTMPPTRRKQMLYGSLVGFLCVPQINILGMYFSPEIALCVGNIFAYLVSPKEKLLLTMSEKIPAGKDIMDILFKPKKRLNYRPGQYMEWTLPHSHADQRGNRRYFTLASSPTEPTLRVGIKFYPHGSSFKQTLASLDKKTPIIAAQLAGEFTLPKDSRQKLAFLAGGIGITPFRSMVKYLIDTKQYRDIVLCYSNKVVEEIAYRDIFAQATKQFGMKVIYTLTNTHLLPMGWEGEIGRIDTEMIKKEIPDFMERIFYLSGPQTMVNMYEHVLKHLGVPSKQIKKDFFPGLV